MEGEKEVGWEEGVVRPLVMVGVSTCLVLAAPLLVLVVLEAPLAGVAVRFGVEDMDLVKEARGADWLRQDRVNADDGREPQRSNFPADAILMR